MSNRNAAQYIEKWQQIARQTGEADMATAKELVEQLYAHFGLPKPDVFHAAGPIHANEILLIARRQGTVTDARALRPGQIGIPDTGDTREKRSNRTNDYFGGLITSHLRVERLSCVGPGIQGISWRYPRGNQEIELFAWDYAFTEVRDKPIKLRKGFYGDVREFTIKNKSAAAAKFYLDIAQCAGYWTPYENLVIVQDRPKQLHLNAAGRLNNPNGPAVEYYDGYGIYAMNGTIMPSWVITTPEEELDPMAITRIRNSQVRAEFVRKIGAERLLKKLDSKLLDKVENYELHQIEIPGEPQPTRFLKMLNPSAPELWHVECVPLTVGSVVSALNFRKPRELASIPIREHGADWFQQGDVCTWPRNARAVKPAPTILT